MITAITGKVGAGKNLYAMKKIIEYAYKGRRVVCNFNVDLSHVHPLLKKILGHPVPTVEQFVDRPSYDDLKLLGKGGPREHKAGLLVLDETGPLLNARNWQQADRQDFIDWLLHSRKLAWDILLLVQNIGLVDKQIRIAVIEMMVTVKRLDRLKIMKIPIPRVHMAVERYGTELNAPIASRDFYRGNRYFRCYDTMECLGQDLEDEPQSVQAKNELVPAGVVSPICPLPQTELQSFMLDISQEFGLCKSQLSQSS